MPVIGNYGSQIMQQGSRVEQLSFGGTIAVQRDELFE